MDLKDYYSNLLIVQYHEKPKAVAETQLGASTFAGDWLMSDIPSIVDVDTAVGAQLDLIGKIVGVPRIVQGFIPDENDYSYNDSSDPMNHPEQKGLSDIGNPVKAYFKDFDGAKSKSIYYISDGVYRNMIKLKIIKNNIGATLKEIDDGIYKIFKNKITITDNFNMTGTVTIANDFNLEGRLAVFLGIFPRPVGVSFRYNYL